MADHDKLDDPSWRGLVDELTARSPAFRQMWERHEVTGPATRIKRYRHPTAGPLTFTATHLALPDHPGTRLIVYTPDNERTAAALRRLVAQPVEQRWHPEVLSP